ncbi:MAG: 3-methyl-2-oxobutanoate hydroxymethyltransferase [Coxiella sp. DG_40]|nr:MAG: 3-methyl-2-oxobutanoate hydroxymethyltransferase [Coxiella sp. DG_40]
MNIIDFQKMKDVNIKISMVTCYDYWSAKIIAETDIDCVLVGDSLAMVMHGHATTIPAKVEIIALHIQAVAKGVQNKFIIGDLPFCSYRKSISETMHAVEKIMQAGANAVKLEGANGTESVINHVVYSGVPVMGHIGMTPQSIHQLGGFCVQGKDQASAETLIGQALRLEKAGCFAIVLECIPNAVAKNITDKLTIPTIGIGAGPNVSGQVLVLHDLLGMYDTFKAKFVKSYINGHALIQNALNEYNKEVKQLQFPSQQHSYGAKEND